MNTSEADARTIEKDRPSGSALTAFIQDQWADIHHSRVQEWTALGVVAGVHLGLLQALNLASSKAPYSVGALAAAAAILGVAFSVLGIQITRRHRHLMTVKLTWIYKGEKELGLVFTPQNSRGVIPEDNKKDKQFEKLEWKGMEWPRPFSTGGLMIGFYALLVAIDAVALLTAAMN